ncbi:MAG: hypothetical protein KC462_09665 [Cyanobacteria bacterium HKST-UBA05]|nr:hypothetical protein [Cyanobacteria bacterium HKST-UBA05]
MTTPIKITQLPPVPSGLVASSAVVPMVQGGVDSIGTWQQVLDSLGINTHLADADKHRTINDSGTGTTDLLSASKIIALLAGKSDTGHAHAATEITSGTLPPARIVTGLTANELVYFNGSAMARLSLAASLGISGGLLSVQPGTTVQKVSIKDDGSAVADASTLNLTFGSGITGTVTNDGGGQVTVDIDTSASPGGLVQRVTVPFTTQTTVPSSIIPLDNSTPQNTEGTELFTGTITPTNAANKLVVRVFMPLLENGSNGTAIGALFRDSTASAVAVAAHFATSGGIFQLACEYEVVAGSTSATTFKWRMGTNSAYTLYVNRTLTYATLFAGAGNAYMTITEVAT